MIGILIGDWGLKMHNWADTTLDKLLAEDMECWLKHSFKCTILWAFGNKWLISWLLVEAWRCTIELSLLLAHVDRLLVDMTSDTGGDCMSFMFVDEEPIWDWFGKAVCQCGLCYWVLCVVCLLWSQPFKHWAEVGYVFPLSCHGCCLEVLADIHLALFLVTYNNVQTLHCQPLVMQVCWKYWT